MINKSLRLSFFSVFMAIDFAIGFIPFGGLIIGWLLLPGVYVLCGLRYAFYFYAYDWLTTLPTFIGSGSTTLSEARALQQPHPPPPVIPYVSSFFIQFQQSVSGFYLSIPYLSGFLSWMQHMMAAAFLSLPLALRLVFMLGVVFLLFALMARSYIQGARRTLSVVPTLISYGIISPADKQKRCPVPLCDYLTWSDLRFKRHLRRKHKLP